VKNLAGRPTEEIDRETRRELGRCGITVVEGNPLDHPEVKTQIRGTLGDLRFTRCWYYWSVKGRVPLEVAKQLYADPVGHEDIRVDGHCGCPPPQEPWISYFDPEGKMLIAESTRHNWEATFGEKLEQVLKESNKRFSADPRHEGKAFVTCYHIDSELGLYIFAQAMKATKRS
jgi:hypothetical protein